MVLIIIIGKPVRPELLYPYAIVSNGVEEVKYRKRRQTRNAFTLTATRILLPPAQIGTSLKLSILHFFSIML